MSHLWNLVKKELRELLTPSSIISVLIIAVMFVALGSFIGGEVQEGTSLKAVGYVDLTDDTGTDYAEIGIKSLKEDYYLKQQDFKAEDIDKYVVKLTVDAEFGTDEFNKKLYEAMVANNLETALVIPEDFNRTIAGSKQAQLYTYWNQQSTSVFSSISTVTSVTAISYISNGISTSLFKERTSVPEEQINFFKQPCYSTTSCQTTFLNGTAHQGVTPTEIYSALSQQTMFVPIIIMLIIVMIGSIVISSMGNEKENKTLETLLTLPVSRMTIVAGKLIGSAIAGLVMGAMYMIGMYFYINGLTGKISSGVSIESLGLSLSLIDWVIVALFVFLAILCALGLCMILGAFAKNTKTAQMYILPISVLAMIPMFVTMFSDMSSLPAAFQALLFIIPFTHPMMIIQNLMFGNTAMVIGGAIYLIAFTIVTMLITVKIYNSDILLTGFIRKKDKKKRDEQPE